jgi:hypothetical protein
VRFGIRRASFATKNILTVISISLARFSSRDDASLPTRSCVRRALVSKPDVDDAMCVVACTIASVRTDSAVRSTAQGRSRPDRR